MKLPKQVLVFFNWRRQLAPTIPRQKFSILFYFFYWFVKQLLLTQEDLAESAAMYMEVIVIIGSYFIKLCSVNLFLLYLYLFSDGKLKFSKFI